MDDVEGEEEGGGPEEGKKHICPTCAKRFNRPSSLRIHVNTHTGATPFRCPHPSCGRAFNVNSNMRRHFRNHASPAFSGAPPSPSWSVSSAASFSPTTPFSPTSPFPFSPTSSSLVSPKTGPFSPPTPASASSSSSPRAWTPPWGSASPVSDVRSEQR
ncbi:hypothetical protein C8R44DRAFT_708470 [Mycena epipterygia]|nr:hypothetical protein C8R44DRAFT_708470 [Mycena epipterygia]